MRCYPSDGSPIHTFSLERRQNEPHHQHGEDCPTCDVRPGAAQGSLALVDFFHTANEIARLLQLVGRGLSLRRASEMVRLEAHRYAEDARRCARSGSRRPTTRPSPGAAWTTRRTRAIACPRSRVRRSRSAARSAGNGDASRRAARGSGQHRAGARAVSRAPVRRGVGGPRRLHHGATGDTHPLPPPRRRSQPLDRSASAGLAAARRRRR